MQRISSLLTKVSPAKKLLMQPLARKFGNSIKPTTSNWNSYLLMGAGLSGMAYLTYSSMSMNKNRVQLERKGETFMSPLV